MSISAHSDDPPLQTGELPVPRDRMKSVFRGLLQRCPKCSRGRLFKRYLKVADYCEECGEELHHHRADDAPPYFTIFIVGHIIVPLVLLVERMWEPALWLHAVIWLPLTVVLSLLILPAMKGAVVGLQWALKMHGFDYSSRQEKKPLSD